MATGSLIPDYRLIIISVYKIITAQLILTTILSESFIAIPLNLERVKIYDFYQCFV